MQKLRKLAFIGTSLAALVCGCPTNDREENLENNNNVITNTNNNPTNPSQQTNNFDVIINSNIGSRYIAHVKDNKGNSMNLWAEKDSNGNIKNISEIEFGFNNGSNAHMKLDSQNKPVYFRNEISHVTQLDYSQGIKNVIISARDPLTREVRVGIVDLSSVMMKERFNENSNNSNCTGLEIAWDDLCDAYKVVSFIGAFNCLFTAGDLSCLDDFLNGGPVNDLFCKNAPECNGAFVHDNFLQDINEPPSYDFETPRVSIPIINGGEVEPNNMLEIANRLVFVNRVAEVSGNITYIDEDYFYFDVKQGEEFELSIIPSSRNVNNALVINRPSRSLEYVLSPDDPFYGDPNVDLVLREQEHYPIEHWDNRGRAIRYKARNDAKVYFMVDNDTSGIFETYPNCNEDEVDPCPWGYQLKVEMKQ